MNYLRPFVTMVGEGTAALQSFGVPELEGGWGSSIRSKGKEKNKQEKKKRKDERERFAAEIDPLMEELRC